MNLSLLTYARRLATRRENVDNNSSRSCPGVCRIVQPQGYFCLRDSAHFCGKRRATGGKTSEWSANAHSRIAGGKWQRHSTLSSRNLLPLLAFHRAQIDRTLRLQISGGGNNDMNHYYCRTCGAVANILSQISGLGTASLAAVRRWWQALRPALLLRMGPLVCGSL